MDIVTGTFRDGRVEFDTPPPVEWAEGETVQVSRSVAPRDIDIRDSSPEALAAWDAHFERLDAMTVGSTFPDELAAWLEQEKAAELARWDETCRRIEAVHP